MKNADKVMNVLDFYIKVNELKNVVIDETNNYSMADHIFGSMILATAINSEFKETKDLGKIYRMLLLPEIADLYPDYDFRDLKKGEQFVKEIKEARNWETIEGRLVFKYRALDFLLTQFIKEQSDKLDSTRFLKAGSSIIANFCNTNIFDCEEIFKFYLLNYKLKNKVRSAWDAKHWNIKADRKERVSEHVVGVFGLAVGFNSEFEYEFDIDKVMKMIVIHETGETIIGDFTPFDGITPEQKEKIEHQAMKDALVNLKEKRNMLALLYEFDAIKTPEAKLAFLCDKMELILQAKIYQDKGLQRSLDDLKNNVVFKNPIIQQMVKDGAREAFDIFYEWDRSKFENNEQFPEFTTMFNMTKIGHLVDPNYEMNNMSYSLKNRYR